MYKMDEGAPEGIWPEGHPRRIAMEERNKLFDQYFEEGADQTHSLEERYWIAVKTNRIMEKCLEETGSDPYIDPQDVDSERKRFLELRDKMEQVRPEQWPEEPGYDLRAFCIETRQQAADQHFDPTASLQDQYWQVFRLNVHMKECLEEISPN
ncbi:hypothetical protein HKBW3S33_02011 [Candidatus Hakubella thermalkaliphila]|nr:hypothetical protein HKBW3S33_02011 [Candidatus Hakubella thermalkaliphila]